MFSPPECKFHELLKKAGTAVDDMVYQRPWIKRREEGSTFEMLTRCRMTLWR